MLAATPVAAQTTLGSSTITTTVIAGGRGCNGTTACNLSFTYSGTTFTVSRLHLAAGSLLFNFSQNLTAALKAGAVLKIGSTRFAFSAADTGGDRNLTWITTSLSWTTGQSVTFSIETRQALATPQNVTRTPGDSEITVSWDAVTNANQYVIEYGVANSGSTSTITNLMNGTRYVSQVQARDTTGAYPNSAWSSWGDATPRATTLTLTVPAATSLSEAAARGRPR